MNNNNNNNNNNQNMRSHSQGNFLVRFQSHWQTVLPVQITAHAHVFKRTGLIIEPTHAKIFSKLIIGGGGVGITMSGVENFQQINYRGA